MKLLELEARWFSFEKGGPHVGLTLLCLHCRTARLGVVFHHRGHEAIDDVYIRAHAHGREDFVWTICSAESFDVLTLTPSIDASRRGHWHGFITGGEVR
jgi:hypothetical protein